MDNLVRLVRALVRPPRAGYERKCLMDADLSAALALVAPRGEVGMCASPPRRLATLRPRRPFRWPTGSAPAAAPARPLAFILIRAIKVDQLSLPMSQRIKYIQEHFYFNLQKHPSCCRSRARSGLGNRARATSHAPPVIINLFVAIDHLCKVFLSYSPNIVLNGEMISKKLITMNCFYVVVFLYYYYAQ